MVGDAGILVDPQNLEGMVEKIEQMLDDRQLRETLIEKGFKRVKFFSWEEAAKQTLKVYQEVAYLD